MTEFECVINVKTNTDAICRKPIKELKNVCFLATEIRFTKNLLTLFCTNTLGYTPRRISTLFMGLLSTKNHIYCKPEVMLPFKTTHLSLHVKKEG